MLERLLLEGLGPPPLFQEGFVAGSLGWPIQFLVEVATPSMQKPKAELTVKVTGRQRMQFSLDDPQDLKELGEALVRVAGDPQLSDALDLAVKAQELVGKQIEEFRAKLMGGLGG